MLDLSRLVPEARPIVERAAKVYLTHTRPWFVGLIVHGSAVKGGFIPGCSDVDLQLYLERDAFTNGHLPLDVALNIHRDLAKIDPAPFGYIQCYALSDQLPKDWTGPIPGAYALIEGRLPVPEATAADLRAAANDRISKLDVAMTRHGNLLEHGAGRLERFIRLLCTTVWPTLYDLLILQGNDPIHVWNLNKLEAMSALPEGSTLESAIQRFYEAVLAYYPAEDSVDRALAVIEHGVAFLQAAKSGSTGPPNT